MKPNAHDSTFLFPSSAFPGGNTLLHAPSGGSFGFQYADIDKKSLSSSRKIGSSGLRVKDKNHLSYYSRSNGQHSWHHSRSRHLRVPDPVTTNGVNTLKISRPSHHLS